MIGLGGLGKQLSKEKCARDSVVTDTGLGK